MKKFLLGAMLATMSLLYACEKDNSLLDTAADTITNNAAGDRDSTHQGGGGPHHGGGGHHQPDSLHQGGGHHPHDSLFTGNPHHLDSLHVHGDSTHVHHGGGGQHPHDSTGPNGGCHVAPQSITVSELPPAAQDWLTANAAGATVKSVRKVTRPDCTVIYVVKTEGAAPYKFDADGNKI
jgi:hypothetical protein